MPNLCLVVEILVIPKTEFSRDWEECEAIERLGFLIGLCRLDEEKI